MEARDGRFDVIVVGGGISGLVTAFELERRGRRVAVVDAGERPGGVIASHRERGFLYESAANSIADTNPSIDRLLADAGLRDERVEAAETARNRYVVRDGRLVALPMSPPALIATRALSMRAKLRLLREPFVRPAPADTEESVAAFVRRRLGNELLDYAIDPFVSGVHAGDPERLSLRAAFPRLHALEQRHGSLIRGQIAASRERRSNGEPARHAATSFSFRNGMKALPIAIASRLANYLPHVDVAAIDVAGPSQRRVIAPGLDLAASAIVLAIPAHEAAKLVADASTVAAQALRAIEYAPVAVVASAYRRVDVTHSLAGFGFLAPSVERRTVLGSLFSSSLFPGRAPEGFALFTTFIGGARDPDAQALDDATLESRAAAELEALVGARTPQWASVVHWPKAIPQYTIGHLERIATIDGALARVRGLFFCGNWRGGISVGDCVQSAHGLAGRVDEFLPR